MSDVIFHLNQSLTVIENTFNFTGYIPGVGSVTSVGRACYGVTEIAIATVVSAVFAIKSTVEENLLDQGEISKRTWVYAKKSLEYVPHGVLNIGRAIIEFVPFLPLFICTDYDINSDRILEYDTLLQVY